MLEKYGGLDKQELDKIKKLGRFSRWFCLRRSFPVVVMHEHGAFLRGSDDKDDDPAIAKLTEITTGQKRGREEEEKEKEEIEEISEKPRHKHGHSHHSHSHHSH